MSAVRSSSRLVTETTTRSGFGLDDPQRPLDRRWRAATRARVVATSAPAVVVDQAANARARGEGKPQVVLRVVQSVKQSSDRPDRQSIAIPACEGLDGLQQPKGATCIAGGVAYRPGGRGDRARSVQRAQVAPPAGVDRRTLENVARRRNLTPPGEVRDCRRESTGRCEGHDSQGRTSTLGIAPGAVRKRWVQPGRGIMWPGRRRF